MTRSVLRMFVVLAAALYLFGGAGGGDVQAYECWHMGFGCDNEQCGWHMPAAPTRGHHYTRHRCCYEGGPDGMDWCFSVKVLSGTCC